MQQGLHHDAVLFGFLAQSLQLLLICLWCSDIKNGSNALKSYWYFLGYPERALQIKIALNRDINCLCRYAHRSGYHLTCNLRTGRQSPQQ